MKKVVLLCSVVFGLFSAQALAANVIKNDTTTVDVYGYAKGAHTFNQKDGKNGVGKSEAQIGVKASQQLNSHFALIGQYEGEYDVNDTSARHWHNRKAFGGIDAGTYGAVTVGRQQGVIYSVAGMSDMMPEVVSGWSSAPDTGLLGRADSVVQYQNNIGNVTVTGQYKLATDTSVETGKKVNEGAAYGASIVGTNIADSGAFVGVAYSNQKAAIPGKDDSSVYSVGGGYNANNVYLAATSTVGTNVTGVKSFYDNEAVAQYTIGAVTPSVGYVDSNAFGSKAKFVETGVSYAFNKSVSADVDLGWDVTGSDNNQVKTSVKYKF